MAGLADEETYSNVDLVCALCDNGGEIASCEGRCLRSFHATKDSGDGCATLGYSRLQFNAMKVFMCKNCEQERYQCFACGCLGSAKTDPPEVFPCASATCGYFYHAKCVAQLLFPENEAKSTEYTSKIASGSKFACPLHKCDICKYGENKEVKELQFAVCRRCPKAYHRRCLARNIVFEDITESGQCVFQRAWEDLLPNNRILIYCLKHDINPKLRTPARNHIKFPEDPAAIKKPTDIKKPAAIKKPASIKKPLSYVNGMNKKIVKIRRIDDLPSVPLSGVKRSYGVVKHSSSSNLMNKRRKVCVSGDRSAVMEKPVVMSKLPFSSFPEIDRYTDMRIYEFAQKTSAAVTMEDVQKKLVVPSTHAPHLHNAENITLGKVERSVEAVKAALHMLENGACIEDAKSVCAPSDLFQLARWKNKLNIFLAPFLHGMRYTSYGRHFTKLDKLQLIVDKLQWYIQSGDTVVDFCCGSNDFSLLLKEKLEGSGKSCFYKNYDLIQPKNDFSFERRDWMTVQPDELPTGCRLIMGLNPPFGFKASLANQFINKALTFKPKLIILIVPKETERLDKKYPPYELIWQDSQQLSGKSFYLPGSLDAENKVMEQWNMSPPPLSLWSRSDWAKRHSEIAKSMGHLPSKSAFSGQREVADGPSVPTAGHVETDDVEGAGIRAASVLEQLLSDTYHDPTSSLGDYWNDTNGRSRQPCNYETPGRSDPTYAHLLEMGVRSNMSISLSETDCERQDQASSISKHGDTDSQACNAVGSALAEEPAAAADGDYWNDTYAHLLEMGVRSNMSISLSETDCERQDQASSISKHGDTNSQACNAVGSALAEEPAAAADGDYWNDTNGRSRQPCNYETPGMSDPIYAHLLEMGVRSDMSISLSETDCERQDQASSISKHGDTNSQACNAVGSALAEEPAVAADCDDMSISLSETDCEREDQASSISKHGNTDSQACNAVVSALAEEPAAAADCDEVTSAAGPYHLLEDSSQAGGHSAGVQYWKMEDSPILEEGELSDAPPVDRPAAGTQHQLTEDTTPPEVTPKVDSHCGLQSRPAARHNARTLPPRNTFPGLRFRQGCNTSRQFLSQGMGQSAVHQGPSNGWIEDDDY